jgi:hypothetical protein
MRSVLFPLCLLAGLGCTDGTDETPAGKDPPWLAEPDTDAAGDTPPPEDSDGPEVTPIDRSLGPSALRRLNTFEYARTIRDLTLLDLPDLTADFPEDAQVDGFDVIADALTTSDLLVMQWEAAAERVATEIARRAEVGFGETVAPITSATGGGLPLVDQGRSWHLLYDDQPAMIALTAPSTGAYRLELTAHWVSGNEALTGGPLVELRIDGTALPAFHAHEAAPGGATYPFELTLDDGLHTVEIELLDWSPDAEAPIREADGSIRLASGRVQAVLIADLVLVGPTDLPPPADPPARASVWICEPSLSAVDACVSDILRAFMNRAWRAPVGEDDVTRYAALVQAALDEGETTDEGLKIALQAVLLSPRFLYRLEGDGTAPLDDHALASRLSYFLWSSLPDATLRARADEGLLTDPVVLAAEADRLLADPRADALVDGLYAQLWRLPALDTAWKDPEAFPAYNPALTDSMRTEARLRIAEALRAGSLLDLIDGDEAPLDARLAAYYGVPAPAEPWASTSLASTDRRGLLGTAAFLTLTADPDASNPVRRGTFVLDRLLCAPPSPPPPGVGELPPASETATTVRERLALHRLNPVCAGCHDQIDPYGLAMEGFDGIGHGRDVPPSETSATLPDGTTVDGLAELAADLRDDPRTMRCLVQRWTTWALSREVDAEDWLLDELTEAALTGDLTAHDVVNAIVTHEAFRTRTAPEPTP